MEWKLICSECETEKPVEGLPRVCEECAAALLVRYPELPAPAAKEQLRGWSMWRYGGWLPLEQGELPVTLGEGATPLLALERLAGELELEAVLVKDESTNPTGSFKSRGLSAAVTRAVAGGASQLVVPTAGNAGVATSAYGARAGLPVKVFAPATTPEPTLAQIRRFGGDLEVVDGHIGDCGALAREFASESGAFDVSTLKEPYRIEGKKTMGLELAEQLGWELPDAVIYPAGGGTGLIGMWKAFGEMRESGWVEGKLPRMFAVQSAGCAPLVRAFEAGAESVEPWTDPWTVASGLRVPAPFGGRLMLRTLRQSGGIAVAVTDEELSREAETGTTEFGIDMSPEGGATLAALRKLRRSGDIGARERVVVFNTGAGWLYRSD